MKKSTKRLMVTCAAAAFTMGATMMSYAAYGWQQDDGEWHYYDKEGDRVTDEWKRSGNNWYWLDEDGNMAYSQLIQDDEDFYYVNETGMMVSNQWRELENEDPDDDEPDTCWYYFGANGKAYKAPDSGKTTFKTIVRVDGQAKRFAFDEDGKMLYGWVNEQSERQTGDDAWRNGIYYLGEPGDGALRENEWAWLEAEDEDQDDDDYDGNYWFYFKSNGQKAADTKKTINGKKYLFEEGGNAVFNWLSTPGSAATDSNTVDKFYSQPSDSWLSTGWFYTIPGEDLDPEGFSDGEACWYYADKDGEIAKSEIKRIKGEYYAFDEYGKMLEGLYKMSVNDDVIQSYEEIECEDDMPEADEGWAVYYFGGCSKNGAMKTGKTNLELDGEHFTFNFRKNGENRGQGYNGIDDDYIYIQGKMQKADRDDKLTVVEWAGDDESGDYLVNTSGKIQKKKKNLKDADDRYYCTDNDGHVTRISNEKCEDHKNNEVHE